MDKLFSCKVFIEIVENNSFVKASEKLNISTAMTSKYLQFLEENLQLRLLNRTNKKISLTEEGKIYFERCKDLINDFEETELSLKGSKSNPKGVLKVALPNWFQFGYFTEGVAKYLEKYPDVIIEFSLNDMIIDLVEEGVDIALRVTSEPNSNLIARRICESKFYLVGTKNYFDKYGRPEKPSDLLNHKYIRQTSNKIKTIPFKEKNNVVNISMKSVASSNSTIMMARMCLNDIGISFVPEFILREEPFKSNLEIVLKDYPLDVKIFLFAVYSNKKYLSPKVRTFIDFMVDWFQKF